MLLVLSHPLLSAQPLSFTTLSRQADSLRSLHQYHKALNLYDQIEHMVGKQYASRQVTHYLHKADCYKNIGEYGKAVQCYDIIGNIDSRLSDREDYVLNKSDVLLLTGRYERVVSLLEPLECTLESGSIKRLLNLASAYESLGMERKALQLLDSVKQSHVRERDVIYQIATNNKGYVLWAMNDYENAVRELQEAISSLDPSGAGYHQALGNLALVEAEVQRGDDALRHIDECLAWFQSTYGPLHPDYVICLRKRAEILLKTLGKAASLDAFKKYFSSAKKDIIDHFAYMSTQERQNYWSMSRPLIARCYALEETDPAFLYNVAVFSKSVLLQSYRGFLQGKAKGDKSKELYEQIKDLRQQSEGKVGPQRTQCEEVIEKLERQLMASSSIYQQYRDDLNVDLSQIRSAMKGKNDVAVEFVRYAKGDDDFYAALVLPKSGAVRFVPLFSQSEIESHLINQKPLRDYIQSNSKEAKRVLFEDEGIAQMIWASVLAGFPKDANIYFAAEGILNILAIEYLNLGNHNYHFYRLSSTRALLEKSHKNLLDKVLVIGGIDFDDASEVLSFETAPPDRSGSQLLFEEQHIRTDRLFPFLYGSQKEARGIAQLLKGRDVSIDTLSHITEERIKTKMGRYSTVHISTHGYSWQYGNTVSPHKEDSVREDKSLSRCFITLSGANVVSKQLDSNTYMEDGLLTSKELCDMDLSQVGLVVLAACQSGLGRTTDDGLVGIPLGLKKAGVGTVIVSLWEVSDEATQMLMNQLYIQLRSGQCRSVAEAFNKARQHLRTYQETYETTQASFHAGSMTNRAHKVKKSKSFDHPYYYDPFIVIDGF